MQPILAKFGHFSIYSHSIFSIAGLLLGIIVAHIAANKYGYKLKNITDYLLFTAFFGIVGAKLSYILIYHNQYEGAASMMKIWEGGLISFGGILVGGLALFLLLIIKKEEYKKWFDVVALALSSGLALGRFGEIFAGDIAGIPMNSRFSINGQVPISMYEALVLVAIFFGLLLYKPKKPGLTAILFLIFYSQARFFIDFWRYDNKIFLQLSLSQLTCLLLAVFSIIIYLIFIRHESRKGQHVT